MLCLWHKFCELLDTTVKTNSWLLQNDSVNVRSQVRAESSYCRTCVSHGKDHYYLNKLHFDSQDDRGTTA